MTTRRLWLACLGLLFSAAAGAGIGLPERIPLLTARIAAEPTDQNLYLRRALVYSDLGEFKLALADVDTAAQFGAVENTYFVRAILLYRLGQLDQALPLLDRFLKAQPKHTEALMYRARALRDAGQAEAALADYRRYFSLQPDTQPGDYLTAARLMVQLADQAHSRYSVRDAVTFLDARIQQLGDAPQLQRYVIELQQEACQSADVLARLEQLHANARRAPQWHLQRAEQQWLMGEATAARESLATARMLLDTRRPSADKTQLTRRYDFLQAVLALPEAERADRQRIEKLYRRHYPKPAPTKIATTPHSHRHEGDAEDHHHGPDPGPESHTHSADHAHVPLTGFDQPRLSNQMPEAIYTEAVQAFYRCLLDRKPKPP